MEDPYSALARDCAEIALQAAGPVLEIYHQDFTARPKADGSPVTEADLLADAHIRHALHMRWPDIPIVSEESFDAPSLPLERYFLVDPLDGTREFLNRTGQFTINIALIENGRSVAGAIYAPIQSSLYFAGHHAYEISNIKLGDKIADHAIQTIRIRDAIPDRLIALASLSHGDPDTEAYLDRMHGTEIRKSGSSLKFCLIARGDADFYPRFSPTMGWDIAAGQAILNAAGGSILDVSGQEFRYYNAVQKNGPFVAFGDRQMIGNLMPDFIQIALTRHSAKSGIAE